MKLKKIYLYICLLFLFVNIFSCSNNSSEYYEQVLSNIIHNTINGTMNSEGRKTVILNEIVRLSYENQLQLLDELYILEPKILKGIKSEIRQQIDKEYKEYLLQN